MRVLLVGSASGRARIRAQLAGASIDVAAEFASLAAARDSDLESDAIIVAPDAPIDDRHVDDGRSGDDDSEIVESLTPREVQVLELLAEGLPNKAIADRL